ncbi:MAG: hypothetical protein SF182_23350 [Deltaproteobacteria bacterium]|nr:hypothetical protein [Deltaproteobacteria bacterium]
MRVAVAVVALLVSGCSLMARPNAPLEFHRAYWSEGTALAPDDGDYELNALAFSSPDEGWVVGNRFALHIQGEQLQVAFLRPRHLSFWDVDLASAIGGAAVGYHTAGWSEATSGAALHYDGAYWQPDAVPAELFPSWWIQRVAAVPDGADRAIGAVFANPREAQIVPIPSAVEKHLLRRAAGGWTVDPAATDAAWRPNDLCTTAAGETWMVGATQRGGRRFEALAARASGDTWVVEPLPPLGGDAATLSRVVCPPAGGIVALGGVRHEGVPRIELVLLRFTDHWQRIALPDDGVTADAVIAALSVDDVWLAQACLTPAACQTRALHWHNGQWSALAAPLLPSGRASGYSFADMQFVAPDEGWAVANDYGGGGLTRGLLFHYRNGTWRVRSWNWHFWNQPGFGWFGD